VPPLSTIGEYAVSPTRPEASKAVKTAYGIVDRKALEALQGNFDTTDLHRAVDAIDQVRYRDDELREGILTLHGMAMDLINGYSGATSPGEKSIGELADRLAGDILECIEHLDRAYAAVQPLGTLIADPDDEEDAEDLEA
jgi:hypothetical protein